MPRTRDPDRSVPGLVDVFVITDAAGAVIGEEIVDLRPVLLDRGVIERKAVQALDANIAFLALPTPTNAQVAAQVNRLTRECSALIRLLLGLLDSEAGT